MSPCMRSWMLRQRRMLKRQMSWPTSRSARTEQQCLQERARPDGLKQLLYP